jgi:PAS domain S-box-containing protein
MHSLADDILRTMQESLLVLDSRLIIIYANRAFYTQFKVSPKDTLGKRIYELGNSQWDIPDLRHLLEKILSKETFFNGFEVEHDFPKLGHKTMLINARQLKDGDGNPPMILVAIEDISIQKKLLSYAIREGKLTALGQLSAGLAHGLNSPLTGVLNFLQVYVKQEKEGSERQKELKLIMEACNYMAGTIKNLTHFASENINVFSRLSLIDVVDSTLLFTERQFVVRNITIVKDYPKNLGKVMGNKSQLQHVVLNALINSKEAMPDGGKITIRIRNQREGRKIILEIIDTGTGISKEDMPHIFEPFFTTKMDSGGTGLGLPALYEIVKKHKGSVTVKSREGKGTTVRIILPEAKNG